jgi:eukaryotic-like serine/threonine-protein kinase
MEEIRLQRSNWFYDSAQPLGPAGGFGEVFAGQSADGRKVAIKRLHIGSDASAHRELRVASLYENQNTSHIIPMYDSGEDADSGRYFIVMALAEKSLQTDIGDGRGFSLTECIDILSQIVEGLHELAPLVHRDLKPGNLLFHEASWKIADFGIAKFIEESTSLNTLKGALSPPFAAPEQWQAQTSEVATDLYAVGCIAYELIAGTLPFAGPRLEDYQRQHLNNAPPELPSGTPPKLRMLVNMLLRKAPTARPSLDRVKQLLKTIQEEESNPQLPSPIAQAAARLEQQRAQEESTYAQLKLKEELREGLADAGRKILGGIMTDLRKRIIKEAPNCEHDKSPEVSLGNAQISLNSDLALRTVPEGAFPQSKLDVVLAKIFRVVQIAPTYAWESALLYCRIPNSNDYRWYEISFRPSRNAPGWVPTSLMEQVTDAPYRYFHPDMAIAPGLHTYQIAFGPKLIDDEDEDEFLERWTTMFAVAAEGRLKHPTRLPLSPDYWKNLGIYGF